MVAVVIQTTTVLPDLWQNALVYVSIAVVLGALTFAERLR